MSATRLFIDAELHAGESVALPEQLAHHALTVLRLGDGEEVVLFNGRGGEFPGLLSRAGKKKAAVSLNRHDLVERESVLHTRLVIALGKGDRTEWAVRKAVELGVSEMVPLFTERTQVKWSAQKNEQRHQRWRGLIISACEQCGRNRLPGLQPAVRFGDWVGASNGGERLLFTPDAPVSVELGGKPDRVELVIGPEGGFTAEEVITATTQGYRAVRLGPRVLRTETAPLAALAVVQSMAGDF